MLSKIGLTTTTAMHSSVTPTATHTYELPRIRGGVADGTNSARAPTAIHAISTTSPAPTSCLVLCSLSP